jgi:hypothetical protein
MFSVYAPRIHARHLSSSLSGVCQTPPLSLFIAFGLYPNIGSPSRLLSSIVPAASRLYVSSPAWDAGIYSVYAPRIHTRLFFLSFLLHNSKKSSTFAVEKSFYMYLIPDISVFKHFRQIQVFIFCVDIVAFNYLIQAILCL